jgi:uncharacterized protein
LNALFRKPASPAGPKALGAEKDGLFEGYASLFGAEDQGHDMVMSGAFRASLARRGVADVRMLFQHDPAQPIGTWQTIREDARGLYVRGRLTLGVARAREIQALMRDGALDGLSIGFHTRKAARDARTGQRRLYEIDLWEISVVTFPMLPGARISAMKSSAALSGSRLLSPPRLSGAETPMRGGITPPAAGGTYWQSNRLQ